MGNEIAKIEKLHLELHERVVLSGIDISLSAGAWLGVLGENGAGKTSLLDLLMGFKKPTQGSVTIFGKDPASDPFHDRQRIAYLSEKVDLPGDWSVGDFLAFHAPFFPKYDFQLEKDFSAALRVSKSNRIGNLSAGEIRRAQIVAALSYRPELIIVDEITAVLDIVGRRKFMGILQESRQAGSTIIFATNIMEGLFSQLTDLLLLHGGRIDTFSKLSDFCASSQNEADFINKVSQRLEQAS